MPILDPFTGLVKKPGSIDLGSVEIDKEETAPSVPLSVPEKTDTTVISSEEGRKKMENIEETIASSLPEDEEKEDTNVEDSILQGELDKSKDAITLQSEQDIKDANSFLDRQMRTLKQSRRNQIGNIKAQYNEFERRTVESTRRRVRLQETIGSRFGGRFTIENNAALVKEQVDLGIQALRQLSVQENAAISKVQTAFDEKSYKLALDNFEQLEKIKERKLKKFDEIENAQLEALRLQREESKKLENQELIAGELEAGLTDPVEIFAALGGEVPFDDITNITKELGLDAEKPFTLGKSDIRYDAQGNVIAMGSGVGGGVGGGGTMLNVETPSGEPLSFRLDEVPKNADLAVAQIGPAIYGRRIANEESARVERLVRQGMAANQTLGEIMLITATFDPSKHKELAAELFASLSIASDPETGLQEMGLGTLTRLLESDNLEGAIKWVENVVMKNALSRDPSMQISEGTARIYARQHDDFIDMLEDEVKEKGIGVDEEAVKDSLSGAIEGSVSEWLGRFRDTDQTKIKNRITEMVAKLRNDLLGSAVTESEERFLEALIPKLSDQPAIFLDKVDRLAETPLVKLNEYRELSGLPKINNEQLLDAGARVELYNKRAQENADRRLSQMSDEDLGNEIERMSGGAQRNDDNVVVDSNGYPI